MLDQEGLPAFLEAVERLDAGFSDLPAHQNKAPGIERLRETLNATAERLRDNYPYFHPLYAGQMLKPPHPVARLAYALAMWINPNNHALDGGRATSAMEKEAVAEIAAMLAPWLPPWAPPPPAPSIRCPKSWRCATSLGFASTPTLRTAGTSL